MQATDELLPVDGLYVPAAQTMQEVEEVLPVDGLYVPASQTMQANWPPYL